MKKKKKLCRSQIAVSKMSTKLILQNISVIQAMSFVCSGTKMGKDLEKKEKLLIDEYNRR